MESSQYNSWLTNINAGLEIFILSQSVLKKEHTVCYFKVFNIEKGISYMDYRIRITVYGLQTLRGQILNI